MALLVGGGLFLSYLLLVFTPTLPFFFFSACIGVQMASLYSVDIKVSFCYFISFSTKM